MKILLQLLYSSATHKHDPTHSVDHDFESRVMWAVNQPVSLLIPAFRQYVLHWCSPQKRTVSNVMSMVVTPSLCCLLLNCIN